MEKMKRMSMETLRNEFPEIEKTEQSYYVGKAKYLYNSVRNDWDKVSDEGTSEGHDYMTVQNDYGEFVQVEIGAGQGQNIKDKAYIPAGNAQKIFEMMAKNTKWEWGMTIQNTGMATFYTDKKNDGVDQRVAPSGTSRVVHSHTSVGTPSEEYDLVNAANYSGVTWTLYYNGQYRDFNKDGFYGEWRKDL